MSNISNPVTSNQTNTHPHLEVVVKKHLSTSFKKPLHAFSKSIFQQIENIVQRIDRPVIFDSGCGNGKSSENLSMIHPDHVIIGIDKSEKRLARFTHDKPVYHNNNLIIARAELIDIWRLINATNWSVKKHYLLYPNPWPKKDQLKRRYHGHPIFPEITQFCKNIELRTNWLTYAEEFKSGWNIATGRKLKMEVLRKSVPYISPFEKKYADNKQILYQLSSD